MHRPVVIIGAALLLTSFLLEVTDAETRNDEALDVYGKKKPAALWFGPRIGRRKRNHDNEDRYPTTEKDQLEKILLQCPMVIIFRGEEKRSKFIPRLGRDSGEDISNGGSSNDRWVRYSQTAADLMSPRLGNFLSYTSRLGRKNDHA